MSELLKNRDFTVIVDKSGSMASTDVKGYPTRWKAAREATFGLASKCAEFDADGLTFYAFNDRFKRHENVTPTNINSAWDEHDPSGGTQLAPVLKDALHGPNGYFTRKAKGATKENGETILVVTDGEPSDRDEVASVIIAATKKMDRDEELSISFIQIGADSGATKFLKKLDDDLQGMGAKYDIVDTLTVDEMGERSLTDVLVSSITD